MGMKYDVIVVGAGIMGSSAAYALRKQGKKTLLIDQVNFNYDYYNQKLFPHKLLEKSL